MKHALLSLFILLLLAFPGHPVSRPSQDPAAQGTPVAITLLGPKRSGPRTSFEWNSGLEERLRVVIRDRDAWLDMWKRIHKRYQELPPLPEIDFSRDMIVVAAMGGRPSSAYGIVIDGAYERDDRLEIAVRSISGPRCAALTVCTSPVDIVRVPKTERAIVFRETEAELDCK